jgi:hypothetical protein
MRGMEIIGVYGSVPVELSVKRPYKFLYTIDTRPARVSSWLKPPLLTWFSRVTLEPSSGAFPSRSGRTLAVSCSDCRMVSLPSIGVQWARSCRVYMSCVMRTKIFGIGFCTTGAVVWFTSYTASPRKQTRHLKATSTLGGGD